MSAQHADLPPHIAAIPLEVWGLILHRMGARERAALTRTNRWFRSRIWQLTKHVTFTAFCSAQGIQRIACLSRLSSVDLSDVLELSPAVALGALVPLAGTLRSLFLRNPDALPDCLPILSQFCSLRLLDLQGAKRLFGNTTRAQASQLFRSFTQLDRLILSDLALAWLPELAPSVQHLDLSRCTFLRGTEAVFKPLISLSLRSLCLRGVLVHHEAWFVLPQLTRLESLSIAMSPAFRPLSGDNDELALFYDTTRRHIFESVSKMSNLLMLDARYNPLIVPADVITHFAVLGRCNLLDLRFCRAFTDRDIQLLNERMPSLVHLRISDRDVLATPDSFRKPRIPAAWKARLPVTAADSVATYSSLPKSAKPIAVPFPGAWLPDSPPVTDVAVKSTPSRPLPPAAAAAAATAAAMAAMAETEGVTEVMDVVPEDGDSSSVKWKRVADTSDADELLFTFMNESSARSPLLRTPDVVFDAAVNPRDYEDADETPPLPPPSPLSGV